MLQHLRDFWHCTRPALQALLSVALFMAAVVAALALVSALSGCATSGGIEEPPAMQYSHHDHPQAREI